MTARPLVAAFDLLCCLLLVFVILALVQKPKANPPRIPTYGQYAVTLTWKAGNSDDLDLYVRDPNNKICYFANSSVDLMHLEHDDLGTKLSGTQTLQGGTVVRVLYNGERTVIRGVIPGEYTVNVHVYRMDVSNTIVGTVQLWDLRGNDKIIVQKKVVVRFQGDEKTAFRFTLDSAGHVTNINTLPAQLVYSAVPH